MAFTVIFFLPSSFAKDFENPIMPAVHALKKNLENDLGLPVHLEPEVLTTKESRRNPEKQEKTRRPKKREVVDASAAAIILQSFIDRSLLKH